MPKKEKESCLVLKVFRSWSLAGQTTKHWCVLVNVEKKTASDSVKLAGIGPNTADSEALGHPFA